MQSGLKEQLIKHLQRKIRSRLDELNESVNSAKASRDNETKSSVGDKYETSREMINFEIEKFSVQLSKTTKLFIELDKINLQKAYDCVEFGSLVFTNYGNYFISIGIGKIEIKNESFFCISLASPIGKTLHHKNVGEKINFQGKEITIMEIR